MLKRSTTVLELEPPQADVTRLHKRHNYGREPLLVFMSDREVPPPNNVSEHPLWLSTGFRKVTNAFCGESGVELYGGLQTVAAVLLAAACAPTPE